MKIITKQGKDIHALIDQFKAEHNVNDSDFAFEVIKEPKRGILSIFGGKGTVQFKIDNLSEEIKEYFREFAVYTQISIGTVNVRRDKRYVHVELSDVSDPGFLIGKDGAFLNHLQYLINMTFTSKDVLNRQVLVDVEEYRKRQKSSTIKKVRILAQQVIKTKKDVTLEPMSAVQRKIVHQAIQNMDEIKTMTFGEGPNKRIVLSYAKPTGAPKTEYRKPRNDDRTSKPITKHRKKSIDDV
jgi:spoIIIJ-associated protein